MHLLRAVKDRKGEGKQEVRREGLQLNMISTGNHNISASVVIGFHEPIGAGPSIPSAPLVIPSHYDPVKSRNRALSMPNSHSSGPQNW